MQRLSRETSRLAHARGFDVVGVAMMKKVHHRTYFVRRSRSGGWEAGWRSKHVSVVSAFPTATEAFAFVDELFEESR